MLKVLCTACVTFEHRLPSWTSDVDPVLLGTYIFYVLFYVHISVFRFNGFCDRI